VAPTRVAAVDMGATSVRVAVVDLDAEAPEVDVVHRWFHGPEDRPDGSVRWRWGELLDNVRLGLERARTSGPLASIGIDGWAVDYGLLDDDGVLLSDPHSYRSPRTEGWRDVVRSIGELELYRRTGIQLMPINTIFQLAAHDRDELARAAKLVMLPELVAYELTGKVTSERSNAGTTGLLDLATGRWADDLAAAIGVDPQILPTPEVAGRLLGKHEGTPVHLVAAHDTACAFAASPLDREGRAFVSSGTWFIVGIERETADTSEQARTTNFSNEIGALAGFRYLKNVTGFWLLERCASEWGVSARDLLDLAATATEAAVFDVRDERFLAPAVMDEEVREAAGLGPDVPRAVVARSIVESVAAAVASVVDELRRQSLPVGEIAVVGGGAASPFVLDRIARHAAVRVVPGATEATALGNALLQGIALGRFRSLADARTWARGHGDATGGGQTPS
jgi:rhamnulokinase